jgi:hypothetical protein
VKHFVVALKMVARGLVWVPVVVDKVVACILLDTAVVESVWDEVDVVVTVVSV